MKHFIFLALAFLACFASANLNWSVAPPDPLTADKLVIPTFRVFLDNVEQSQTEGKLAMIKDGYIYGLDDNGAYTSIFGTIRWAPENFNGEAVGDVYKIHWSPDGINEYSNDGVTYTLILDDDATYSIYYTASDLHSTATTTQAPAPTTTQAPAVDCVGTWSAYIACSAGQKSRTFTVTTQPANGGQACPASPESASCTGDLNAYCTDNSHCTSNNCLDNDCVCQKGYQSVDGVCMKCVVGKWGNGKQTCSKWSDRFFAGRGKPTTVVDIRSLIDEKKTDLDDGNRRRNVRDMIQWMKSEIVALSNRVRLKKDSLSFSPEFSQRLNSRGNDVDVFIPKSKTKLLDPAQACDEADVEISSQYVPYEINQEEGETALVCKDSVPVTKLLMERDGELHNEENDVYKYSCYDGSSWSADVEVTDGGSYLCGTQSFFVNSLSGVTCNSSDPVSSIDSNLVVGTDSCGTIAEGEVCTSYTCNTNFVSQSDPSCTVDGYQPAVCHCPSGYVEDGTGGCNVAPTTTQAPTTQAPVTTEAPVTTQAPVTTEAPVTTQAPTQSNNNTAIKLTADADVDLLTLKMCDSTGASIDLIDDQNMNYGMVHSLGLTYQRGNLEAERSPITYCQDQEFVTTIARDASASTSVSTLISPSLQRSILVHGINWVKCPSTLLECQGSDDCFKLKIDLSVREKNSEATSWSNASLSDSFQHLGGANTDDMTVTHELATTSPGNLIYLVGKCGIVQNCSLSEPGGHWHDHTSTDQDIVLRGTFEGTNVDSIASIQTAFMECPLGATTTYNGELKLGLHLTCEDRNGTDSAIQTIDSDITDENGTVQNCRSTLTSSLVRVTTDIFVDTKDPTGKAAAEGWEMKDIDFKFNRYEATVTGAKGRLLSSDLMMQMRFQSSDGTWTCTRLKSSITALPLFDQQVLDCDITDLITSTNSSSKTGLTHEEAGTIMFDLEPLQEFSNDAYEVEVISMLQNRNLEARRLRTAYRLKTGGLVNDGTSFPSIQSMNAEATDNTNDIHETQNGLLIAIVVLLSLIAIGLFMCTRSKGTDVMLATVQEKTPLVTQKPLRPGLRPRFKNLRY